MNNVPTMPDWLSKRIDEFYVSKNALVVFPFDPPPDADIKGYFTCHQNNYLRLSAHPEVIAAKNAATEKTGSGAMASMTYGGAHDYHSEFRERVARVSKVDGPDGIQITTSGWSANVGLISSLATEDTPIYIDMAAHASLWDGGRLSAGRIVPIRHNRPKALESFIESYGPGIVIIDSYYSTSGAVSPLEQYADIAQKNNCVLVLDEAHSFGMIGEHGGGLAVALGLESAIHYRTVSLAKALGGSGGLIITSKYAGQALPFWMRPSIFSSAPPPANSAGNSAALAIIEREPHRAAHVHAMAKRLRELLTAQNIDTGPSECQIVSLRFKGTDDACLMYGELLEKNILTAVFLPPAVPSGSSLLRFSLYSDLSENDIDLIGAEIIAALKKFGLESRFPGKKGSNG